MNSPESSEALELPEVEAAPALAVVEAEEQKPERVPFTVDTAFESIRAVVESADEGYVRPNKRIARLAKQFAQDGLISIPQGESYHLSMTPVEGVERSEELIGKILMTRALYVQEPAAPNTKQAKDTPKKKPKKGAPRKRPDVSLEDIALQALEAIDGITLLRDLEVSAYSLHKVGILLKIDAGQHEWGVKAIDDNEISQELAEAVMKKKNELTVDDLRYKAFRQLSSI